MVIVMGIFSSDEEPSWGDVIYLEEKLDKLNTENLMKLLRNVLIRCGKI